MGHQKSILILLFILGGLIKINAQELSQEVKRFVSVDPGQIAITNVNIIDGTGDAHLRPIRLLYWRTIGLLLSEQHLKLKFQKMRSVLMVGEKQLFLVW